MKSPVNPAIIKKVNQIQATHIPTPKVANAITELKAQKEASEILPGMRPIWAKELKLMDIPPPSWLVEQFVSDSGISLISSKPGNFKTMLAIEIAKCVAKGEPLFEIFQTKQSKVLIIDEESGNGRLKKRQSILGADEADIASISFPNIKMSEKYAEAIIKYCKTNGIGLVIFDSLTRFHVAQENTSQEMSEVLSYFHLIPKAGIAIIIIHHDPKSGYKQPDSSNTLRGSGDILAISDVHIALQKDKYTKNKIIVKQLKSRDDDTIDDFELVAKNNEDKTKLWFEYLGEAPKVKSRDELAEDAIIEYILEHGLSSQSEIIAALTGTAGQTKTATILDEMAYEYRLVPSIGKRGKKFFDLPTEQENE